MNRNKISSVSYVISPDAALQYGVLLTPYAMLIDQNRVVRAKGLVNHFEHLESLLNAADSGYPSVESFIKDQPNVLKTT